MKKTFMMVMVGALLTSACGGDEEAAAAAASERAATPAAAPAPTPSAPAPAPAPAVAGSNFGTVTLAPGFRPDPTTENGSSGGSVAASTLDPGCAGWVSGTPDHLVVASADFPVLRVMARADTAGDDITLVIQRPDGGYLCSDDDAEGLNPLIAAAFPAGTYKVWVGSYEEGQNQAYRLGLSEVANIVPSSLAD